MNKYKIPDQIKASIIVSIFFIFTVSVYLITSAGKTPYDYFVRLSGAFLKGQYWLIENPSWLSELIPAGEGRFYIVFPPMPAILLMPFVYFFGIDFPQQYLAHILGAGIVTLCMLMAYRLKILDSNSSSSNKVKSHTFNNLLFPVYFGLLIGFGTIVWYMSATGSVWYLGQITSAFFLTAALYCLLRGSNSFLSGIFLGAAYLSRIHIILSLPVFLYLLLPGNRKSTLGHLSLKYLILKFMNKEILYFFTGLSPFILFNLFYNYLRFGVVWDRGYLLIPKVLNEPWYQYGIISYRYILKGLEAAFWSFPKILPDFPYIQPSWAGLAIWITTPAFFYSLRASIKEPIVRLCWLAILLIFIFCLSHGNPGWTQFGYRFAVDFYPFLILLTIKGVLRTGLKWHHWLLLSLSIIVNLWGVLWINKFGWVSF